MKWSVVGHDAQKELFGRLLKDGALSHAYLLHGPDGIGKRSLAVDVARVLLETPSLIQNPDALVLAPGVDEETGKQTDITVEAVRNMKAWAYQRPLYGTCKVVVIDDADRLGDAAANTLLKVLEEPPEYLYFFLVSALPGALLQTITSRCQEVGFTPVSSAQTTHALADLSLDGDDRELLASVTAGRPGAARALVDAGRVPEVARAIVTLERLLKSGLAERFVLASTLAKEEALPEMVAWWLAWLHTRPEKPVHYASVAGGLLELSSAVSESKFNRRLALERFLLGLQS